MYYDKKRKTFKYNTLIIAQGFPYKVRFQRYIVGRPNLLTLDIKLAAKHLNYQVEALNFEVAQYYYKVDVWCVNDTYPPRLEIDTRLFSFDKPLRFRDLETYLPEGMWLHRKYDREYNNAIAGMTENWNHILSDRLFSFPDEESAAGEGANKDETPTLQLAKEINEKTEEYKKSKKKAKKDIPFSLTSSKKLMQLKGQGANAKAVKEALAKGGKDSKKK